MLSMHYVPVIETRRCSISHRGFSDRVTLPVPRTMPRSPPRSEEHTSELQSRRDLVCRLLLEKKKHSWDCMVRRTSQGPERPVLRGRGFSPVSPSRPYRSPGSRPWCFFFNDTATTEIYTLSLHDALPI